MKKYAEVLIVALIIFTLVVVVFVYVQSLRVRKVQNRGVYVYMYDFLDYPTPRNWTLVTDVLENAHLNMMFPLVKHWGFLYYRSDVGPLDEAYFAQITQDADPLRVLIDEAHKKQIEVHVWLMMFADGHTSTGTSRILEQHPDWAMVNFNGKSVLEEPAKGSQYWLCPSQEGPRTYLKNIIEELAQNYSIDGINFDYIRYPDENYCFCDHCKSKFMSDNGIASVNWSRDVLESGKHHDAWIAWRSQQITSFVEEVSSEARKIKPNIRISASIYPFASDAVKIFGQDWATWAKNGYVDMVNPMIYHRDYGEGVDWVRKVTTEVKRALAGTRCSLHPAVGGGLAYTRQMPAEEWVEAIKMAERGGAQGVVLFAYVCVEEAGAWEAIGRYFEDP